MFSWHTPLSYLFFFFNDTATTEIYTLSLHDALPICVTGRIYSFAVALVGWMKGGLAQVNIIGSVIFSGMSGTAIADRKSTRLNSSHANISYAVFCLKKKK